MSPHNGVQNNNSSPVVALVLGKAGAGKSSFIKAATGLDVAIGNYLQSCLDPEFSLPISPSVQSADTS